jgi:hypothetical protein
LNGSFITKTLPVARKQTLADEDAKSVSALNMTTGSKSPMFAVKRIHETKQSSGKKDVYAKVG